MAAFDEQQWRELRDRRKRGEILSQEEQIRWQEIDAAKAMLRAQKRMALARRKSRRFLNSIRMELGTIVIDAGLRDAPRERIRHALEILARELEAEDDGDDDATAGGRETGDPPAQDQDGPDTPGARILAAVAAIPEGAVTTYGRIAEKAGLPGEARAVGEVLARHPEAPGGHRVVNAEGRLSTPSVQRQRERLEAEGVKFVLDRIDLNRFAPGTPGGA